MRFKGKNILITGSNKGLGLSLLKSFHSEGANIIAHSRLSSKSIQEFVEAKTLKESNIVLPLNFDLRQIPTNLEIKNQLGDNFKNIDVLVLNAAVYTEGLFQMYGSDSINETFEINLFSNIKLIQMMIPYLRKSSNPSIILISSISSLDFESGNSIYSMTKAGINALTKSLYKELSLYNIRVNAVAPGLFDTDMAKSIEPKAYQKALDRTLLHKPISPDDIAKVVLFLASEDSKIINGEIIRCDGGRI
jgi:3-oxoacyl-[acyl-carrier protein] reductase